MTRASGFSLFSYKEEKASSPSSPANYTHPKCLESPSVSPIERVTMQVTMGDDTPLHRHGGVCIVTASSPVVLATKRLVLAVDRRVLAAHDDGDDAAGESLTFLAHALRRAS